MEAAPEWARGAGFGVGRLAGGASAGDDAPGPFGLLVGGGAAPGPGQVALRTFMERLEVRIRGAADEELAPAGRTAEDCPYLETWLAFYRTKPAGHVERAIRHYAPGAGGSPEALEAAVVERVREAVRRWRETGDLLGIPGQPPLLPAIRTEETPPVLRAAASGALPPRSDPGATMARLGPGRPLDGGVRSRMERGLGVGLGDVRVHTDATGAALARHHEARAFAVGEHIAFAPGEYRPGSIAGDALLAHELAHTVQQGPAARAARTQADGDQQEAESEAHRGAASAALRMHSDAHELALRPDAARLTGGNGLRLLRCITLEKVPPNLGSVEAKAQWIRATLAGSASRFEPKPGGGFIRTKGQAIVDVLSTLSADQFMDIQPLLDMSATLDALTDFEAVRLGTLGPIDDRVRGRLNRIRASYLFQMTRDRGAAQATLVAHWMFANMYGDDIEEVLGLLAGDHHLYNTIDKMPAVLELLRLRGIDRKKFEDRSWKAGDFGRGLARVGESILGSSEIEKYGKAQKYLPSDFDLPEPYSRAIREVMTAEFEQSLTPTNLAFGTIDYIAFNIPSSVVGVVEGTISGIGDLAKGHVEAGTEKLTGTVVMVITVALGVRAFRRSQRAAALMELTEEGQAGLAQLRVSIGDSGIQRVAKYVQADSKAAFFVRKHGVVGAQALEQAGGKVAAARRLLKPKLEVIPAKLSRLKAAEVAKELGLPNPPSGYWWSKNRGRLTVAHAKDAPPTTPKLVYDSDTRTFCPDRTVGPARPPIVKPTGTVPAELEQAATDAVRARDAINGVSGNKTGARLVDGTAEASGYGKDVSSLKNVRKLSNDIGHTPEAKVTLDRVGGPGSFNLSHAEKKLAAKRPGAPMGISEIMCPDCQLFFQKLANKLDKQIVIADPAGVRVFTPRAPIPVPVSLPALIGAAAAAEATAQANEEGE